MSTVPSSSLSPADPVLAAAVKGCLATLPRTTHSGTRFHLAIDPAWAAPLIQASAETWTATVDVTAGPRQGHWPVITAVAWLRATQGPFVVSYSRPDTVANDLPLEERLATLGQDHPVWDQLAIDRTVQGVPLRVSLRHLIALAQLEWGFEDRLGLVELRNRTITPQTAPLILAQHLAAGLHAAVAMHQLGGKERRDDLALAFWGTLLLPEVEWCHQSAWLTTMKPIVTQLPLATRWELACQGLRAGMDLDSGVRPAFAHLLDQASVALPPLDAKTATLVRTAWLEVPHLGLVCLETAPAINPLGRFHRFGLLPDLDAWVAHMSRPCDTKGETASDASRRLHLIPQLYAEHRQARLAQQPASPTNRRRRRA